MQPQVPHDFIVGTTSVPQFVNAAGIESPGLSSCLAIAKTIEEILQNECGYSFEQKSDYIPTRPKHTTFKRIIRDLNWQKKLKKILNGVKWSVDVNKSLKPKLLKLAIALFR